MESAADLTQPERFWAKVNRRGPDECWEWTGARVANGYGQVRVDRVLQLAHRVSWWMVHGRWPTTLDHTCHNIDLTCRGGVTCPHRRCVNPAHLEEVTQSENLRRSPHMARSSR